MENEMGECFILVIILIIILAYQEVSIIFIVLYVSMAAYFIYKIYIKEQSNSEYAKPHVYQEIVYREPVEEMDESSDETPEIALMRTSLERHNTSKRQTTDRLLDFRQDYQEMGCTVDNRMANYNKYQQAQQKINLANSTKRHFNSAAQLIGNRENNWWEDESWHS
jgi:hypothetical protein